MPTVDYGPKVKGEVRRIKNSESLIQEDRDLLHEYKRDLEIEGLSDSRIFKVLIHTRKYAERLDGKSLAEATEGDIKDLVAWVQKRDLADSTKRDYREILKRFYKWLNGGEYPEKVEWISTTRKKKNKKLPEKMLGENDVEKLLNATRNSRDSALISLMWETGARPGEYLDLRVCDVEDREKGKKVLIDGKTGSRRLPLVSSVPHLNIWLSQHPANRDPEAPLWCRLDGHPY
ncbi:hypothetical protein AKJ36_02010 [candidate division MSBL1 archaeon SCGC-AAA259I07]|uniref:Core-binding (CB) domain-containing protein n=1 Tax=candidate division MSBL1 archaeon SCGC-AAA259I07 TaxID=1698266 RepID=A0A133UL01_9EURY|nr:hypothetical protein AKJ36_02010 [candidate division MSBL1 archaeon SCGC-AAA259I07]